MAVLVVFGGGLVLGVVLEVLDVDDVEDDEVLDASTGRSVTVVVVSSVDVVLALADVLFDAFLPLSPHAPVTLTTARMPTAARARFALTSRRRGGCGGAGPPRRRRPRTARGTRF